MSTDHTQAKGPAPDGLVASGSLPADQPEIAVYLRMMRLKRQFRRGWLRAGIPPEQVESVADHAWGCALLALLLAPRAGLDPGHCALLALVHELGEIHAGDITPHDGVDPAEKRRREAASLDLVLAGLEADAGDTDSAARLIRRLWQEYEDGESPAAVFVKRIDRLEMGFQAAVYRAEGHGDLADFHASVRLATDGSTFASLAAALEGIPGPDA